MGIGHSVLAWMGTRGDACGCVRSPYGIMAPLPAGDSTEPHSALFLVFGYLRLPELLAFRQLCRAFRDEITADETLWRHITVKPPLSNRLYDEKLLWITSFARKKLKSLVLQRCWQITDAGLLQVLDQNPHITKLFIPGCTSLTADGVVRAVKRLAEQKGYLEYLRLDGACNINTVHLNVLKSLLVKYALREAPQPFSLRYWRSLDFNPDDRRPIDVDVCPKCRNVGMVFDCTREDCRTMKNRRGQCRGCFFCITRCKECGGCLNRGELGEGISWSLMLCAACWLRLPKCSICNRPCCREDEHEYSRRVLF